MRTQVKFYCKIKMLDGKYAISTSPKLYDVVKTGLTEAEANAFLKLLQEPITWVSHQAQY